MVKLRGLHGQGTKEERIKRLSLEKVEQKIRDVEEHILSVQKANFSANLSGRASHERNWYINAYHRTNLKKLEQELAEWQQIRNVKSGIESGDKDDEDDEDEQEEIAKIIGVDSNSSTGIGFEEDEEGQNLDDEMKEAFGDDDPEAVYEAERQTLKDWDNIYGEISEAEAKGLGIDWDAVNKALEEDDTWYIKNNEIRIKIKDEKTGKKRTINWDKKLARAKATKEKLEEKMRKKAEKMERMRELIRRKDEQEQWEMWNRHVSYNFTDVRSRRGGGARGGGEGSIISYDVKRFR